MHFVVHYVACAPSMRRNRGGHSSLQSMIRRSQDPSVVHPTRQTRAECFCRKKQWPLKKGITRRLSFLQASGRKRNGR